MTTPRESVDERYLAAIRTPRKMRMGDWLRGVENHHGHPEFQVFRKEGGSFVTATCDCLEGHPYIWEVSLTSPHDMLPEVREMVSRLQSGLRKQNTRPKKEILAANRRAKVLLHSHLTKEQRQTSRHGWFMMTGKDGHTYRIEHRSSGNVARLIDGKPRIQYCCVSKKPVPLLDQLFMQKVMLESCPEEFFKLANKHMISVDETGEPLVRTPSRYDRPWRWISDEESDDPLPWIRQQLVEMNVPVPLSLA